MSYDLWIWLQIETNLTIICASVPPLNGLFQHIRSVRQGAASSDSKTTSYGASSFNAGLNGLGGHSNIKNQKGPRDPYSLEEILSLDSSPSPCPSRISVISSVRHSLVGLRRGGLLKPLPSLPRVAQQWNQDEHEAEGYNKSKELIGMV